MDQAHLIEAIDAVLRRLGGTARVWRTDRMATVIVTGTADVQPSFPPVAKHYGVTVRPCPPRRGNRKGAVEASVRYLCGRWWRTMTAATIEGGDDLEVVAPSGMPVAVHALRLGLLRGLSDITWTTSGSGAVDRSVRYDPWGDAIAAPGGQLDFGFQGSWRDPATDLSWVVTRWYAPMLGAFISEDSLLGEPENPRSRHLYAYGWGDPIGSWDSDGRQIIVITPGPNTAKRVVFDGDSWLQNSALRVQRFMQRWYNLTSNAERNWCVRKPGRCARWVVVTAGAYHAADTVMGSAGEGRRDAFRHCFWQACLTVYFNANSARLMGNRHERKSDIKQWTRVMDLHNNEIGRSVGRRARRSTQSGNTSTVGAVKWAQTVCMLKALGAQDHPAALWTPAIARRHVKHKK